MPNWCENVVQVTGPEDKVAEFVQYVAGETYDGRSSSFCFNKVIPVNPALYEGADWYDFCVNNWGTKWEPSEFIVEPDGIPDDGYAEWQFHTAWSPPEGVFHTLRNKFPDVDISWFYHEPGMRVAGYL
jgi:hypothetical protein